MASGAGLAVIKSANCLNNSDMVLRRVGAKSYGVINIRVFPRVASLGVLGFNAKST